MQLKLGARGGGKGGGWGGGWTYQREINVIPSARNRSRAVTRNGYRHHRHTLHATRAAVSDTSKAQRKPEYLSMLPGKLGTFIVGPFAASSARATRPSSRPSIDYLDPFRGVVQRPLHEATPPSIPWALSKVLTATVPFLGPYNLHRDKEKSSTNLSPIGGSFYFRRLNTSSRQFTRVDLIDFYNQIGRLTEQTINTVYASQGLNSVVP